MEVSTRHLVQVRFEQEEHIAYRMIPNVPSWSTVPGMRMKANSTPLASSSTFDVKWMIEDVLRAYFGADSYSLLPSL